METTKIKIALLSLLLAVALVPHLSLLTDRLVCKDNYEMGIVVVSWLVGAVVFYRVEGYLRKKNFDRRIVANCFWIYSLVLLLPWILIVAVPTMLISPIAFIVCLLAIGLVYYFSVRSLTRWYINGDNVGKNPNFMSFSIVLTGCSLSYAFGIAIITSVILGGSGNPWMIIGIVLFLTLLMMAGFVVYLINKLRLSWHLLLSVFLATVLVGGLLVAFVASLMVE